MVDLNMHATLTLMPVGLVRVRPEQAKLWFLDNQTQASWCMRQSRRSRGVIIKKHFPHRQRLSLIDELEGRIEVIPLSWQWASYAGAGALISYSVGIRGDALVITDVQLLDIPHYVDELTHLFMHHVLELCYFCVPISSGPTECFGILQQLITSLGEVSGSRPLQKLIIARLLSCTGQGDWQAQELAIAALVDGCRKANCIPPLDERDEHELERYIYYCLRNHPYGHMLKTIIFMNEGRKP